MLVIAAAPAAPPMLRMLTFIPLAMPVFDAGTRLTTRLDNAPNAEPNPIPMTAAAIAICHGASLTRASINIASAPSRQPAVTTFRAPSLATSQPAKQPTPNVVIEDGRIRRPDSVTLEFKP